MDTENLINTTQAGKLLAELTGNKGWDRRKVAMYRRRGTKNFPPADVVIANTPYWERETIEKYANQREEK